MIKELGNIKLFRYYHFITKWSLIFTCIFWLGCEPPLPTHTLRGRGGSQRKEENEEVL